MCSWAVIDYFERPKPAYYVIARALSPVAVGVIRLNTNNPRPNLQHEAFCKAKTKAEAASVIAHATPHIYPPRQSTFSVWIANSTTKTRQLKVEVRFISIKTGADKRDPLVQDVLAKSLGTTEVTDGETPEDEPTVVFAKIYDEEGNVLSTEVDWPQPLKHISFPSRGLKIDVHEEQLTISTEKPLKGLVLVNDGVQWSDNCLDVVPGETQRVTAKGLTGEVRYMFYEMDNDNTVGSITW